MHHILEVELVPLDSEIERTLRNLKKKKVREIEKANMAEQRNENQNIPIAAVERPQ